MSLKELKLFFEVSEWHPIFKFILTADSIKILFKLTLRSIYDEFLFQKNFGKLYEKSAKAQSKKNE